MIGKIRRMFGKRLKLTERVALLDAVIGVDKYDREFYKTMLSVHSLPADRIDDKVKYAILRYSLLVEGEMTEKGIGATVAVSFIHGYLVGQELRRDIRKTT